VTEAVRIAVRDTGRGIPRAMLARVFDPLQQGEAGPRGVDRGLGLGLTIVRRLVELHGGRVEAASDGLGCGSTFTVTLPTTAIPQRLVPTSAPDDGDLLDGIRVLLIKPDRMAAEAVALVLENANADVVWVRQRRRGRSSGPACGRASWSPISTHSKTRRAGCSARFVLGAGDAKNSRPSRRPQRIGWRRADGPARPGSTASSPDPSPPPT
jgi:hypothetical protein